MKMFGHYHPRTDGGEVAEHFKHLFRPEEVFYIPLPGEGGQMFPVGTQFTYTKGFEKEVLSGLGVAFEVVRHRWRDDEPEVLVHTLQACGVWGCASIAGTTAIVEWLRKQPTKLRE